MQPLNNVDRNSFKITSTDSHQEKVKIDTSAMLIKSVSQSVEMPIHNISYSYHSANISDCNECPSNGSLNVVGCLAGLGILRHCLVAPAETDIKETLIKIRVLWDYYHWNPSRGAFIFRVNGHILPQWKIDQWHFCFQHGGLALLRGSDNLSQSTSLSCSQMLEIFNTLKNTPHTNLDKLARTYNKKRETLYKFVENCGYIYNKKNHLWELTHPQISNNQNIALNSVPVPQLMQPENEENITIQTPDYLHNITQCCDQNCLRPTGELLNKLSMAVHFPAKTETLDNQQKFAILYNYYQTQANQHSFTINNIDEDTSKKIIEDWNFCFTHGGLALLRGCHALNESMLMTKENMLYAYISLLQEKDINIINLSKEIHHSIITLKNFLYKCGFFYLKNPFKNQKCWQLTEPRNEHNYLPSEPASITFSLNDAFFQPEEENKIQPLGRIDDSDLITHEEKTNNLSQEEKELYSFIFQSNLDDLWDNAFELTESNQSEENVELNEDLMESLLPELQAEEILSDVITSSFNIGSQITFAQNNSATPQTIQNLSTATSDSILSTSLSVAEVNTVQPSDQSFWLQFEEESLKPIRFRKALIQFTASDWSIDKKLEAKVKDKTSDYTTQFINKSKKLFQLKFKLHTMSLTSEALALIELENNLKSEMDNLSAVEKLTLNINKVNSKIKSIFNNAYEITYQNFLVSKEKESIFNDANVEHQRTELGRLRRTINDVESKIQKVNVEHIKAIEKTKQIHIKLKQIAKEHSFSLRDKNDIIYFHLLFDLENISDEEIKLINMIIVRIKNDLFFSKMEGFMEYEDKTNPYHYYFQKFHLSYKKYQIEYKTLMLTALNLMEAEEKSEQSETKQPKETILQEKRRNLNKALFDFSKISIENDTYLNILGTEKENFLPTNKTLQILKNELTSATYEQAVDHKILNEKITKLEKIMFEHNINQDEIVKYVEQYLKATDYLVLIQVISAKKRQQQICIETDNNQKMSDRAINRTSAHSHLLEQKTMYLETIKHQVAEFRATSTKESLTVNSVRELKRSASETINAVPAQKICF